MFKYAVFDVKPTYVCSCILDKISLGALEDQTCDWGRALPLPKIITVSLPATISISA